MQNEETRVDEMGEGGIKWEEKKLEKRWTNRMVREKIEGEVRGEERREDDIVVNNIHSYKILGKFLSIMRIFYTL